MMRSFRAFLRRLHLGCSAHERQRHADGHRYMAEATIADEQSRILSFEAHRRTGLRLLRLRDVTELTLADRAAIKTIYDSRMSARVTAAAAAAAAIAPKGVQ